MILWEREKTSTSAHQTFKSKDYRPKNKRSHILLKGLHKRPDKGKALFLSHVYNAEPSLSKNCCCFKIGYL